MLITVLLLLCFGLAVLFATALNGWREAVALAMRDADDTPSLEAVPSVAHIVPVRDGADTIVPLLQDLYMQEYPQRPVNVIVVDDGSTDGTAEKVRAMMPRWPGLRLLPSAGEGKKAAITTGVNAAETEWIVLSDADTRCGPERLRLLLACAQRAQADMILLPVATDGEGSLGRVQVNEQAALMMCAMAGALQGRPLLANGANMAFRRSVFLEVGGYEGDRYASGDDVFLLRRMVRAGKRVAALPHPGAVVRTEAERTVRGFLRQRLRWAGKMSGVPLSAKALPALALLFPWGLLTLTFGIDWAALVGHNFLMHVLLMVGTWAVWLSAVPALVRDGTQLLGQRYDLPGALLSWLAFAVYAPVIALLALVIRPVWKGRRV